MSFGPLPDASAVHDESSVWLEVANNLLRLQDVSARQLLMPGTMTNVEADDIGDAVRLIEGEKIESEWTSTQFESSKQGGAYSFLGLGSVISISDLPAILHQIPRCEVRVGRGGCELGRSAACRSFARRDGVSGRSGDHRSRSGRKAVPAVRVTRSRPDGGKPGYRV
jgi:hypothetical protein